MAESFVVGFERILDVTAAVMTFSVNFKRPCKESFSEPVDSSYNESGTVMHIFFLNKKRASKFVTKVTPLKKIERGTKSKERAERTCELHRLHIYNDIVRMPQFTAPTIYI